MRKLHRLTPSFLLLLAICVSSTVTHSGCSLVATTMYIVNPNDIDAEYEGLVGQRVAVVCESDRSLPFDSYMVTHELAEKVSELLRQHVEKIDVVKTSEISDWTDLNELNSYAELGSAMNADLVVVLKLAEFRVRQGQSMVQGRADVAIEILDVATGEVIHELDSVNSTYPPNAGISKDFSQRRFEDQFRRQYVRVLADQVARRFYDHDSRMAIKTDRYYQEP